MVLLCGAALTARGEVVRFQNGVAPTPEYAGCVDTQISIHKGEGTGVSGAGKAPVLRTYINRRRVLVRFDLSAIAAGKVVTKARLRLYCATPARLKSEMHAAPLTQAWDETATGFEYRKTDDDKSPEGNWKTAGGDYDEAATVKSGLRAGAFGHAYEFDVTPLAAAWLAGSRTNHGVVCWSGINGENHIASSEWPVAAYRPELLVEYAAAGKADAPPELAELPLPPKDIALSPVAATPDPGTGGATSGVVRLGMNAECVLRDGTADAYVKTHPDMAGRWGWMPFLKAGGSAGDFNAALLRFDLAKLPRGSSIRSARLRLCVAGMAGSAENRFGLYRARSGAPVWEAETVTQAEWREGSPWGKDGLRGAFEEQPVAVASKPRPGPDPTTGIWLEWDVTGAVRASAGGPLSVAVLHDLEGGAFDAYSGRHHDPARRPVLEVELSPAPAFPAPAPFPAPAVRAADDWVAPMKAVHARFKGKPGTFGQYGDSITYTMAFLASHSYGATCIPAKCPEDVRRQLAVLDTYARKSSWRDKGVAFGNISSVTSDWGRRHIREWQERLKPEVAVIMFGTNDAGKGPGQPGYMENLAYMVDRCLADGTIPILTTASPRTDQKTNPAIDARVRENREAVLAIARAKRIPLIDYYGEILARQPENWDKTLMGDQLHPSAREPWRMDFTEEALKNSGYTLRNYLTLRMYADIVNKVLLPARESGEAAHE